MKEKKDLLVYIFLNMCISLFFFSFLTLVGGGRTPISTLKSAVNMVFIVNIIYFLVPEKTYMQKLYKKLVIISIATFMFVFFLIFFSDSYKLLCISRLPNIFVTFSMDSMPKEKIFDEKIDDNTYLLVYKTKNGENESIIVKKFLFAYYVGEQKYSWNDEDFSKNGNSIPPFKLSVFGKDIDDRFEEGYVSVARLWFDEARVFADGKEMKELSNGEINFAYYYFKGRTYRENYQFISENEYGEVVRNVLI